MPQRSTSNLSPAMCASQYADGERRELAVAPRHPIHALQRTAGNQATGRLLSGAGPSLKQLAPSGSPGAVLQRKEDDGSWFGSLADSVTSALTPSDETIDRIKSGARDDLLEGVGELSGMAKQVTEVADTGMWLGTEYAGLKGRALKALEENTGVSSKVAGPVLDSLLNVVMPGAASTLGALDSAAGLVQDQGWVEDKPLPGQPARASLTAPFSAWLNDEAKSLESAMGVKPDKDAFLTPLEQGEIAGSLKLQTALAFTGAEEVKVALNVVGGLEGLRGVVETVRRDPDGWVNDPGFWGGLIGIALSIVGLKHSAAASKFTTLLMKGGWTLQAVPLILEIRQAMEANISADERDRRVKACFGQALNILKDGVLHVAQSHGESSEPSIASGEEPPPAAPAAELEGESAGTPSPAEASGIDVDPGQGQEWRGQTPEVNEVALSEGPNAALELDTSGSGEWRGQVPVHGEIDLGPLPPGDLPKVYRGSKPVVRIPGVKRPAASFGEPGAELSGTHRRTGMHYNELNAAEIAQGLNVSYDASAGRPVSVSYRVDARTGSRAAQTDRTFSRDASTLGAQASDGDYTNSGMDRGHLAQREAFQGDADVELAADLMTNIVPMEPALNRGAGSPWRAAERRTMAYADQFDGVRVLVEPQYDANPRRLPNGTPIPSRIRRQVVASDGTVLEDMTFDNVP